MGFMDIALAQARHAHRRGEVPVGAVLVRAGQVIAADGNRIVEHSDPTAHAEILVLRGGAEKLATPRLAGCDLYVTLEPCTMCAGAISLARIRRLYFGAADEKAGAVEHGVRFFSQATCHHRPDIYSGIGAEAAADALHAFFRARRR